MQEVLFIRADHLVLITVMISCQLLWKKKEELPSKHQEHESDVAAEPVVVIEGRCRVGDFSPLTAV